MAGSGLSLWIGARLPSNPASKTYAEARKRRKPRGKYERLGAELRGRKIVDIWSPLPCHLRECLGARFPPLREPITDRCAPWRRPRAAGPAARCAPRRPHGGPAHLVARQLRQRPRQRLRRPAPFPAARRVRFAHCRRAGPLFLDQVGMRRAQTVAIAEPNGSRPRNPSGSRPRNRAGPPSKPEGMPDP
jgi:hypothetical protein